MSQRVSFEEPEVATRRRTGSDAGAGAGTSMTASPRPPPPQPPRLDMTFPSPIIMPSPEMNLPGAFPGTTPTSASSHHHHRSPFPAGGAAAGRASSIKSGSTKRNSTRVIKTFEEIPVPVEKTVMAEEWYEELECGICSHVLGAPHALVPCGHSFCGVCAWQWIKMNKNYTCPHCRMEVFETTPIVPNIIVDQIIERKLRSLPDGKQKVELLVERREKAEGWKSIQASLAPKPATTRRSRGLGFGMDNVLGFFENPTNDQSAAAAEATRRRRASRHFAELGAPLSLSSHLPSTPRRAAHSGLPYGTMNLGDIRRLEAEEDALATRMEVRRLREALYREQSMGLGLGSLSEEPMEMRESMPTSRDRPEGRGFFSGGGGSGSGTRSRSSTANSSNRPSTRSSSSATSGVSTNPTVISPQHDNQRRFEMGAPLVHAPGGSSSHGASTSTQAQVHGRPTPLRSSALAARQARGRSRGGANRENPLVILSDSEGE